MERYIGADAALKRFEEIHGNESDLLNCYNADWIVSFIEAQPTADVQEVREWISVKKDLPRDGLVRVLLLLKNEEKTDGIGFPRIDTDRYIGGKWARWGSHVTYWMPLPNAAHQIPKGEHE